MEWFLLNRNVFLTVLLCFFGFVQLAYADSVVLGWTAVGDDGQLGTAYEYDLRYATSPINKENFYLATRFGKIDRPLSTGRQEQVIVDGLNEGESYFFALKVADDRGNWSQISNVVVKTACEQGCIGYRGNVNGDPYDLTDITDLLYMVDFMFKIATSPGPQCDSEADVDASGQVDIGDLLYLVDYMFANPPGPAPERCP